MPNLTSADGTHGPAATVRTLGHGDLDALLALLAHLHRTDDPLPERTVVERTWEALLDSRTTTCLGGFAGDALVASCVLTIVPNLTRGCRPYAIVENVVTHAAHRRRGHGRAVLARALELAWARRCYKVTLTTGRQDAAIRDFYESAGFIARGKSAYVARPPAGG